MARRGRDLVVQLRLLLDTNAVIWFAAGSAQMGATARAAIDDASNEKHVSVASIWEIAIKRAIGRLDLGPDVRRRIAAAGFSELDVDGEHAERAGGLPLLHGDPFDRMLVAQAQIEGLTLVTSDAALARYGVAVLPAT